jgi:hypothetical protein
VKSVTERNKKKARLVDEAGLNAVVARATIGSLLVARGPVG